MAVDKPVKVPVKDIGSVDVPNFGAGQFLNGDQDGPINGFVASKDVELTPQGYMIPRRTLTPFLPDTVETTYEKKPILWNGNLYYFTADDGKVRYCQEGDPDWTDCTGDNSITTQNGGQPKFLRVLNNVLCLNGDNGDKLCFVDLTTTGFPVVKEDPVIDPVAGFATPTFSGDLTGSGSFVIYYAYTYSGNFGETLLSPILSQPISDVRDHWQAMTNPGSLTLTRPGTIPAGATYWNLYIANASTGGTIQPSDMLQLAMQIDLATDTFVDNASLSINLGGVAPLDNSTDGPRVADGIVEDGNPILYRDKDNPYAIHIGGGGPNAMFFSVSQGGYLAEPEEGTNYYANSVIGFRNNQGIPSLTVFYSNTEGLSKQSVLEQQTVNYGDQSFTVWGVTEQHYGAAGVASPNSTINYNGKLLFLSTDGFLSASTQPTVQNVLSINNISGPIDELVRSIRNEALGTVVGAGWNNKFMWLCPTNGFSTPQQIVILDTNNKGVDGEGAWDTLDIPADWIGVVSPNTSAAFVYLSIGNKSYKLLIGSATYDTIDGVKVPFSTGATGTMIGMGGQAHNVWQADVQCMFYVVGLIGKMTIGVTYRNQNGKLKTKTKDIEGPDFIASAAGGWGDPGWLFVGGPGWSGVPAIDAADRAIQAIDLRKALQIDDIFNEAQWFYSTPVGFNTYKVRVISYEGINLGVRPDLQ